VPSHNPAGPAVGQKDFVPASLLRAKVIYIADSAKPERGREGVALGIDSGVGVEHLRCQRALSNGDRTRGRGAARKHHDQQERGMQGTEAGPQDSVGIHGVSYRHSRSPRAVCQVRQGAKGEGRTQVEGRDQNAEVRIPILETGNW